MVQTNLFVLGDMKGKIPPEETCHLLNLPFNGKTGDFYSDNSSIGSETLTVVHIYTDTHISSQEEFMSKLSETYNAQGLTVTIEQSP